MTDKIMVRIDSVNENGNITQYETTCDNKVDAVRVYMNYKVKRGFDVFHVAFETIKTLF